MKGPILEVRNLVKVYPSSGGPIRAVDGVSFAISAGEALALVGESGSGKSTTARCIVRLAVPTSGTVLVDGEDIFLLRSRRLRHLRRRIQIIFQDPYSSLNPRMTVRQLVEEGLIVHRLVANPAARYQRVNELMELVGLDETALPRYPQAFSGGQRQRIAIARALSVGPDILVCDEPVSSLDVSIQAQILNLFTDLRERLGLTTLLIAHDLAVVRYVCDRVAVMHQGQLVELGSTRDVYGAPKHPYTRELLLATPIPDPQLERERRRVRLESRLSPA
jgi:peptide/nickel transport system ATP-binding protein